MRGRVLAALGGSAMLVAGCSTPPPANVDDVRRVVGTSLIGAAGATAADQDAIDETVAGLCGGRIWTRRECREHDEAARSRRRRAEG